MKIYNFEKVSVIVARIRQLEDALKRVEDFSNRFMGDHDGTQIQYDALSKLNRFHICEIEDGSGPNHIDLTGCMVGTAILEDVKNRIQAQLLRDRNLLETL